MYILARLEVLNYAIVLSFLSIFAFAKIDGILEKRRHERDGYGVEPLSHAIPRGEDWWGVTYFHGSERMWFDGKAVNNNRFVLHFPTKEYWPSAVPGFLADQRELVLLRIEEKLNRSGYKNKYSIEEIDSETTSER